MKLVKLFFRYIKKYWFLLIFTVVLIIFLNYVRSLIPKIVSSFIAIVENKPIKESEIPSFLLSFYDKASNTSSLLLVSSILLVVIAFVREITNIFCDVNIYKISEIVGCKAQIDYFKKVQDLPYSYLNHL